MKRQSELWQLYVSHRADMFSYALSLTRSVPLAEDAVHNAIAATARGNGAVRKLRPYVFRAIRNECLRLATLQARTDSLDDVQEDHYLVATDGAAPDMQAMGREQLERLHGALGRLSEDQREAILLRTYSGLKFREIATVLNKPLSTVAAQYRRGLRRLGKLLETNDEG